MKRAVASWQDGEILPLDSELANIIIGLGIGDPVADDDRIGRENAEIGPRAGGGDERGRPAREPDIVGIEQSKQLPARRRSRTISGRSRRWAEPKRGAAPVARRR